MTVEHHSEHNLAARLQAGDEEAFGTVHREYGQRLLYYAIRLSLSRSEAEDAVADAFLKLWQGRTGMQSELHVRNFLFVTVRNFALNLLDFQQRRKGYLEKYRSIEEARQESFSHERVEAEMLHVLYAGMEKLPPECKKIFELYLQDLSTAEIAARLNIAPATVRSQKRRAILLLRQMLGGHPLLLMFLSSRFFF